MVTFTTTGATLELRSPELKDTDSNTHKVDIRWDMSNRPHTFVKKPSRRHLDFTIKVHDCGDLNSLFEAIDFFDIVSDGRVFTYKPHSGPTLSVRLTETGLQGARVSRSTQTLRVSLEVV
jgi:hypothetical protein